MTMLHGIYQLQDKIDVAHFLGLEYNDIAQLDKPLWSDLRAYAKRWGLKI